MVMLIHMEAEEASLPMAGRLIEGGGREPVASIRSPITYICLHDLEKIQSLALPLSIMVNQIAVGSIRYTTHRNRFDNHPSGGKIIQRLQAEGNWIVVQFRVGYRAGQQGLLLPGRGRTLYDPLRSHG
jgi:hypothetical protein